MPTYDIVIEKTATVKTLYRMKCPEGHALDINNLSVDTIYDEGEFVEFLEADDWGHPNDSCVVSFDEDETDHSDEL